MYDTSLIVDSLCNIEKALSRVLEQTETIKSVDDFLISPTGMLLLDGVCMNLLAVGEALKIIDNRTERKWLPNYPAIPWKDIIGIRDKMAHHYFEVDAEAIFDILRNDLPPLLSVIKQMKEDLLTRPRDNFVQ
jgi:uncharacterized protein with HEPN domain